MPRDRPRLFGPERVLETRRLLLEPLTAAHAAELYEPLLDPRLYDFIPQDPPASLRALEDRYRKLSARRSPDGREARLNWEIRDRETGACIGLLEATVRGDGTAFVAYTVFAPFQRGGFAEEGCGRLLQHLFGEHAVELTVAEVDTRNVASVAPIEALGFRRVALRGDADHFKGSSSDEYRHELRRPQTARC